MAGKEFGAWTDARLMILQDVWFVGLIWDWFKDWCSRSWSIDKVFDEILGLDSFEVCCGM